MTDIHVAGSHTLQNKVGFQFHIKTVPAKLHHLSFIFDFVSRKSKAVRLYILPNFYSLQGIFANLSIKGILPTLTFILLQGICQSETLQDTLQVQDLKYSFRGITGCDALVHLASLLVDICLYPCKFKTCPYLFF